MKNLLVINRKILELEYICLIQKIIIYFGLIGLKIFFFSFLELVKSYTKELLYYAIRSMYTIQQNSKYIHNVLLF